MILLLAVLASPIEAGLDFGDLLMERFMEAVETHKKQEEAGEGGVDKDSPGRLGEPPPLPGLASSLELGHGGAKIGGQEARVTDGRPKVGSGERAQAAIKSIGDTARASASFPSRTSRALMAAT